MKPALSRYIRRLRDGSSDGLHLLILLGVILPLALGCWMLSLALRWFHQHGRA